MAGGGGGCFFGGRFILISPCSPCLTKNRPCKDELDAPDDEDNVEHDDKDNEGAAVETTPGGFVPCSKVEEEEN